MSDFSTGIPNIRVVIREAEDANLTLDVPNLSVKVEKNTDYNVNITPSVVVTLRTGSYNRFADVALLAYTASYVTASATAISASYAQTASYAINAGSSGFPFSGSAVITGSLIVSQSGITVTGSVNITDNLTVEGIISAEKLLVSSSVIYESGSTKFGDSPDDTHQFTGSVLVQGPISASSGITGSLKGEKFQLNAGTVSIVFTGSINTGIFGATEYIQPYISTTEYSGMTVEYLAQRPGACRMGIIMASWLNTASVVFTDISTTDIGDTSDISFRFLSSSNELRLRVNSDGSGSGAWTVQSLFKLFPNLNP